jgi:hypothetical protein
MEKMERLANICGFPPIGKEPDKEKNYFLVYDFKFTKKIKLKNIFDKDYNEPEVDPDYIPRVIPRGTIIFNVIRENEGFGFDVRFEGETYHLWTYYPYMIAEETPENRLDFQYLKGLENIRNEVNRKLDKIRKKLITLEIPEEKPVWNCEDYKNYRNLLKKHLLKFNI